jgi:nucleotide-binding universal stress UspA family protein
MELALGLVALAPLAVFVVAVRMRSPNLNHWESERRILLPIIGRSIPRPVIDFAFELAHGDRARVVLAYVVTVPMSLELEPPVKSERVNALVEAVKQRARSWGVPVDVLTEAGRTHRHALGELVSREPFDWLVIPAASNSSEGFSQNEVTWLLGHAPGQVLVLRPESD